MKTTQTTVHRSGAKWLPGAMALAATAASSHAATVQITLTGNKISSTSAGGNTLNADLTGDGTVDYSLDGATPVVQSKGAGLVIQSIPNVYYVGAGTSGPGYGAKAAFVASAAVGDKVKILGVGLQSARALNPITFSDRRINSGAVTNAWLEVHAFNTSATSHTVQLTRLIFNDAGSTRPAFTSIPGAQTEWTSAVAAAVPEPSSSFALLGLGAAGLLLRRRHQAA